MTEATHTSESIFGLFPGHGTGPKLWAGCITVSDGETLDTGLDTIEGAAFVDVEPTDIDGSTLKTWIKSISAGVITFIVNDIHDYTDGTDVAAWGIVVGSKR